MSPDEEEVMRGFYQQVGINVRMVRKRRRLTQEQLGDAVRLARSSIANLEAGRQHIPLHLLAWIAAVLDVAPQELLPQKGIFRGLTFAPNISEHLANVPQESMRTFVETAIAKLAIDSQSRT